MELLVHGDGRQKENAGDMVYSCTGIVQYASIDATAEAGEVVTVGTLGDVGPLEDGDVIDVKIAAIGSL